jgi:hypothetical protein
LLKLKQEYNLLLCVDEALSMAGVGPRGLRDAAGAAARLQAGGKIDIYLGSLEFAVGSIGGFCAGPMHLVRDLRLTSSGYCFSASAPGVSCLWSAEVVSRIAELVQHRQATKGVSPTSSTGVPTAGGGRKMIKEQLELTTTSSTATTDDDEDSASSKSCDSSEQTTVAEAWTYLLKQRFAGLASNVEVLQEQLKRLRDEEHYETTGQGYVVHLRPKKALAAFDNTGDLEDYNKVLETIARKVPEIDVYERPAVEKALDARLRIPRGEEKATLRFSVSAKHTKAMITDLCSRLGAVAASV